jgi:hypothetical protein
MPIQQHIAITATIWIEIDIQHSIRLRAPPSQMVFVFPYPNHTRLADNPGQKPSQTSLNMRYIRAIPNPPDKQA